MLFKISPNSSQEGKKERKKKREQKKKEGKNLKKYIFLIFDMFLKENYPKVSLAERSFFA